MMKPEIIDSSLLPDHKTGYRSTSKYQDLYEMVRDRLAVGQSLKWDTCPFGHASGEYGPYCKGGAFMGILRARLGWRLTLQHFETGIVAISRLGDIGEFRKALVYKEEDWYTPKRTDTYAHRYKLREPGSPRVARVCTTGRATLTNLWLAPEAMPRCPVCLELTEGESHEIHP